jgi:hypothetical protein
MVFVVFSFSISNQFSVLDNLQAFLSVLNIDQADFSHDLIASLAVFLLDLKLSRDFLTAVLISALVGKDRAFNRSVFLVFNACKIAV